MGLTKLSEEGEYLDEIRAAADDQGRLWAVWDRKHSEFGDFSIAARRCEPGEGWLGPDDPVPGTIGDFATGSDGEALLLYYESFNEKVARRWTVEDGWEESETIDAYPDAGARQLAIAGGDAAMAMWTAATGGPYQQVQSSVRKGDGWSAPLLVDPAAYSEFPAVAGAPDGTFVGLWTHGGGALDRLYWGRFDGSWAPPAPISPEDARASFPELGIDSFGRGFATWESVRWTQVGGFEPPTISAARFDGTGFGPPDRLFDGGGFAAAVDGGGTAFVVTMTRGLVSVRRFDGEVWEEPIALSGAIDPLGWRQLDVATDGRGGAVVAWLQDGQAWASRYRPGAGWDEAAIAGDSGDAYDLEVAVAPDGTALVLIKDQSGEATAVWGAVIAP